MTAAAQELKPNPADKTSAFACLGDMPANWEVRRQRNLVRLLVSNIDKHEAAGENPIRLCNYVDVYKNERITARLPFMRATASMDEVERFRLLVGDVIITKDSEAWNDIGVPALVEYEDEDLVCGYHLAILRPVRGIIGHDYLLRALQSPGVAYQFHIAANGITRYGLSQQAIKNVVVPVPPLSEQTAIVRFLDHADRRIRRYINAKRRLIALLDEQKQAIIHRAITRGLDPNVPLKPSGVEWLGDVPEHWSIQRTKNLFRLRTEKSGSHHGMELLSIYTHIGVRPRKDLEERGNKASTTDDYWIVRHGDIIVNKLLAWMGAVGRSEFVGVTSPAYDVLMPTRELVSEFYHYLFRTKLYLQQFKQRSRGIMDMRLRLYFDQLGQIPLLVPPEEEQSAIVRSIPAETAELIRTHDRVTREIELIREYRTRLIADVVTGKLDVREAAAALPDEAEDVEEIDEMAGADADLGDVNLGGEPDDEELLPAED